MAVRSSRRSGRLLSPSDPASLLPPDVRMLPLDEPDELVPGSEAVALAWSNLARSYRPKSPRRISEPYLRRSPWRQLSGSIRAIPQELWIAKVCAGRKSRREVLFAKRRMGRGSGKPRKWRITSQYGC